MYMFRGLRRGLAATLVLCFILGVIRPVSAHHLGAECTLRGNKVEVEAFFDDNTPARNAKVSVLDAANQEVAHGRTDEKGHWAFSAASGRYQVLVDAGDGHAAKVAITIPAKPPESIRNPCKETHHEATTRFHPDRSSCGHCHHRHPGRPPVEGGHHDSGQTPGVDP